MGYSLPLQFSPDLAGVQDAFRVEGLLDGLEGLHTRLTESMGDIRPLGDADAVLAGRGMAEAAQAAEAPAEPAKPRPRPESRATTPVSA